MTAGLASLVPGGTLTRGTTVTVRGAGATSLAVALGAAASATGSWCAVVGWSDLDAAVLDEMGIALDRVVVVPTVPPASWATVVGAFVDAVDFVLVAPPRVSASVACRVGIRVRERGAVLVSAGGPWPGPADLRLELDGATWEGLSEGGTGRLRARRVWVTAGGRGAAAAVRRHELWLPALDGQVQTIAPASVADDGADDDGAAEALASAG